MKQIVIDRLPASRPHETEVYDIELELRDGTVIRGQLTIDPCLIAAKLARGAAGRKSRKASRMGSAITLRVKNVTT